MTRNERGASIAGRLFFCLWLTIATAQAAVPLRSLKEIREQGVVMQRWDNSCGAAALATVLTHHLNHPVSEQSVAAAMLRHTEPERVRTRGGFSLLDLKHAVEDLGHRSLAYQHLSIEDLEAFRAPIVPLDVLGFHHYVVVTQIDASSVSIADPAFGNRSLERDAFAKAWMNGLAFVII